MRHLAVLLLLSACSGSKKQPVAPDAPDGLVDAGGSGDGGLPAGDVQVLVRDGFAPISGVRVLFDGSDGSHMELATDATGTATAMLAMGGNVTVIRTYPSGSAQFPEIYSYVGVKPGDQLHVGHAVDGITPPTTISVKVPAPAQGTVKVTTPCGSGQGNAHTIAVAVAACPPNITFFMHDGAQESFLAKAPAAATVDLSQQILADDLSTTMLAFNVTPDLASVTAEARAMEGPHELYSSGIKRVDQQSTQLGLPNLAGEIDELVIGTMVATAGGTQVVATRSSWEPMTVSIDASGHLLPYLRQAATFASTGIMWVEQGTGTPTAVLATIVVTTSAGKYRRTILAPYSGMSLAIPQLAGADATYNPAAGDQLAGELGLVGSTTGYDAVRPWALGVSSVIDATAKNDTLTLSYPGNTPPTL
jgi:hypothetical protein